MSIEYYAALDKDRLPSSSSLNTAAREMGIPVEVGSEFSDLSRYGFKPARFDGRDSGIEAGIAPLETVQDVYEDFDSETTGRRDSVVTFTFGSDARQGAVAMGVCAVLSRISDALIYSTDDGCFVDEAQLTIWMHELGTAAQNSETRR